MCWTGVLALFVAGLTSGPNGVEQLLFGWLYFPFRVIPQMTVDWPSVIVGCLAIVGFVICLHMTLRWWRNQSVSPGNEITRNVNGRTTAAFAVFVLILFAAGTAMVGALHQVAWLATGRATSRSTSRQNEEPVRGVIEQARTAARRTQQRNNLKQLGFAFHNFHDAHSLLPPGGTIVDDGQQFHGWPIYLGNFASYSNNGVDFTKPWNAPPNDRLYR